MHQVRYFLAAARILNFTPAAEECNVPQPSLTRAIKLLEEELGGELFRRDHKLSHLTDLGERMLPLLQRCDEAAQGVKQLAHQIRRGEVASLRLALSYTIDIAILVLLLTELTRSFPGLELKFLRGTGDQVAERLKKGDADLCIAGGLGLTWDRLDTWPLLLEDGEGQDGGRTRQRPSSRPRTRVAGIPATQAIQPAASKSRPRTALQASPPSRRDARGPARRRSPCEAPGRCAAS